MNEFAQELIDEERFAAMSPQERTELCFRAGYLRHKLYGLQQGWYDKYRAWATQDLYAGDTAFVAGSLPRVFVMEVGKRVGKTTFSVAIRIEDCIRYPGTKYRHTTAAEKNIGEILSDVLPYLLEGCPPDVYPTYQGKKGPRPAGLYFPEWGPAQGSAIYLAGLEERPDALRGQSCDGDNITEAAFIPSLLYALKNVLYHQYQGKPRARVIVESSAPKDLDTDWESYILPDGKQRNAHVVATIEDNTRLSRAVKDEFIAASGGRGHPDCEREYFNVIAGDPQLVVVPEFSQLQSTVVNEHRVPRYAYTLTAADPGTTHLFGLVFGYVDFDAQKGVVQDSWCKANAPTRMVAAVTAAREYDLWGTWPSLEMKDIPLMGDGKKLGWKELLLGDRCAELAEDMHRMAQTPELERPDFAPHPHHFTKHIPIGHFCYWDGARFRPNPYLRVSDVEKRMIADISTEFGLEFQATSKEELRSVMVAKVRNMIGGGQLEFQPNAGPVLEHTRAAKWDAQRRKFAEHPVHGHFDCIAEGSRIATERGDVPIEQVRAGDRVWTRAGLRPVLKAWLVGTRPTWLLETTSRHLEATGDHRVWTENGWKHLAALTPSDILCTWESSGLERPSGSKATPTAATPRPSSATTVSTSRVGSGSRFTTFTTRFGRSITALCRRAWTFITSTETRSTTTSPTWSFSLASSTPLDTSPHRSPSRPRPTTRSASFAEQRLWRSSTAPDVVAGTVWRRSAADPASTTSQSYARGAASSSGATSTPVPSVAREAVLAITPTGRSRPVYDLTVEGEHEFFANGVLVHNCLAALVYWVRAVDLVLNRRPHPPVIHVPVVTDQSQVIDRLPWQKPPVSDQIAALNELLGHSPQGGRQRRQRYGHL